MDLPALPGALTRVVTRDQGLRLLTAGVAGPALIWAGYKYPGTLRSRGVLIFLGAALVYSNYSLFLLHNSDPDIE